MAVPKARTVIRERYQLESMIGEGGMASVWRARDLTLARLVAVKLLFARDDRDRSALTARFLREARIAASVQHRNVIQIVDFGTTEDELPFMVMELLEGEPLSGRMHRERRLPVADVVQIANLTLRGLAAVHNTGIIHRDLKPDNIYLKRENQSVYPKILDFGISRSVEPQSGRRSALTTREGLIIGTPEYMSPEQARGVKDIDPRTDLYSMGVIMYECLTGRLPFHSENVGDLIIQVVTGTAPTVHDLMPEVPLELSKVVEHAMARKREERFSSAVEMQSALLDVAGVLDSRPSRTFSDMPSLELMEGSGTRRLTPSERVTWSDTDSLPAPLTLPSEAVDPEAARVTEDALDSNDPEELRQTTDALNVVPPVTQTLDSRRVRGHTQASQSRRRALFWMAVAAAVYTAFVLIYARLGGKTETAAAGVPTAELTPPPPSAASVPPSTPASAQEPKRAAAAPAPVVEVQLGNPVEAQKPAAAPKPRPRNRTNTNKLRKAQGALRNLDF